VAPEDDSDEAIDDMVCDALDAMSVALAEPDDIIEDADAAEDADGATVDAADDTACVPDATPDVTAEATDDKT